MILLMWFNRNSKLFIFNLTFAAYIKTYSVNNPQQILQIRQFSEPTLKFSI